MQMKAKLTPGCPSAFDMGKLRSNTCSFSELSSTTSLGINCRREDLDAVVFQNVTLQTTSEAFSVRGKRDGDAIISWIEGKAPKKRRGRLHP